MNLAALFRCFVAIFFACDLAFAIGGEDAIIPYLRFAGFFLHFVAIVQGLLSAQDLYRGASPSKRGIYVALTIGSVVILLTFVWWMAKKSTMTSLEYAIGKALAEHRIAFDGERASSCGAASAGVSVKVVRGAGFVQRYDLAITCSGQQIEVTAKRSDEGWILYPVEKLKK